MRVTFAGLPFEKMKGVGAKTYENYKKKYGKEPTSYALYAAEAARVAIDAHQARRRRRSRRRKDLDRRSARPSARPSPRTKNFEGINGKWSFDENGDSTTTPCPASRS